MIFFNMGLRKLIFYAATGLSALSCGCIFQRDKTATFANGASSMRYSPNAKSALDNSLSLVMQMDGIKEEDEKRIEDARLAVLRSADRHYGNDDLRVSKKEGEGIYEQVNRRYLDLGLEGYAKDSCLKDALKGKGF